MRLLLGRRSLVARLVLTFLALSVLMVGIVGTVSYLRARDALKAAITKRERRPQRKHGNIPL